MIRIEQMIKNNRASCSGCYSCWNSCYKDAIIMEEDEEGFRYPRIDAKRCVGCGACERACPVLNPPLVEQAKAPDAYAAINRDEAVRQSSSSGGIFHSLAMSVLQEGGIVFGAGFDEKWEVAHQSAETENELKALQVSKYLQSRAEDSYQQVRENLNKGRKVLFCGTPCQCAALRTFLHKDYPGLLLVDFICHGVPSPAVWRRYLAWRTRGEKIHSISFRNKNISWERFQLAFFFNNAGRYLAEDLDKDLYMKGFLQNLYLRPSCYECRFCQSNRPTDITLADFWGVEEELPEASDHKGTSLVFIHSERGKAAFAEVSAYVWQIAFAKGVKHNPSMLSPAFLSPRRAAFFREFVRGKKDIGHLLARFTGPGRKARLKTACKKIPGGLSLIKLCRGIRHKFLK